ncbi:DUF1853 family protein [Ferrimonas pelagia]|uniref:DUF1853 family protein n=1 Tax=Ferrimonas pelagia TaxID=1177826 RepID=A0ABP9EKB8_9GAMM
MPETDAYPLQHPILRDLQWLLSSPCLLRPTDQIASTAFLQQFAAPLLPRLPLLERRLDELLPFLNRQGRLGHYYERLWLLALKLHPDYQVLAHDLHIKAGRRTLGALDLLIEHLPSQQIEHWELAIKFYLGEGETQALNNWIGPGRKDRLANKLDRLTQHQLPLAFSSACQQRLQQQQWRIDQQRIVVQGRLYHPDGSPTLPTQIAPDALQGRWYPHSQLPNRRWLSLSRYDWLAARPVGVLPQFQPTAALSWPRHLLDPGSQERIFVVPDNWSQAHSFNADTQPE